jgi:ubiquinone/menaquinone biosynthesis C-methylase UbiE
VPKGALAAEGGAGEGSAGRDRIFDPIAGVYSWTFPLIWKFGFPHLHRWLDIELQGAQAIIDAGTGPGYWAAHVASTRPGRRIVGVDLSERFLERARRRTNGSGVEFIRADLTTMPLPDGSFDAVICSGVLDTLPRPELALREFARVLRPGGRVLLILRGGSPVTSRAMERFFRFVMAAAMVVDRRGRASSASLDSHWEREQIQRRLPGLAASAGLEVSQVRGGRLAANATLLKPTGN